MKIQLKNNQTPNDDLTLIRGEQEINVFDKISTLSTKTFNAATITIEDTEGTPSATATINNNTLEMQFTSIKGEDGDKGKQGPDGIIGNTATYSSNVSTLFNVANTTGNSTTKTMTQKAITDLFQNITLGIMDTILDIKRIVKIYGDNLKLLSAYFVIKNQNLILNDITKPGNYIENIQIIMGNDDITSTAYSNNVININSVTDNVTITIETTSVTDATMFTKRTTGNGINILNNKALLKSIRGNTILWRNLGKNNFSDHVYRYGGVQYYTNEVVSEDGVQYSPRIGTTSGAIPNGMLRSRDTPIHAANAPVKYGYADVEVVSEIAQYEVGLTWGINHYTPQPLTSVEYANKKATNVVHRLRAYTTGASNRYLLMGFNNYGSDGHRWFDGTKSATIKITNWSHFSLTYMFGLGKEPSQAKFMELFPLDNYDYNDSYIILNSMTASYISKDNNNETLQTVSLNIPTLTGKLNGEGESVIIFPNGMKSTVCLPNVTPDFIFKSDSKPSYIDLDYVPTGNDIVIKTKIRYTSYIGTTYYLPWFTTKTSGWNETLGDNFYGILRRTNTNGNIYAFCGNKNYTEITGLTTATVYEIELSNGNLNLNGTDYTLDTTAGNENTYSMKLLAGLNAYLYYYQIYKGEDLVVDCIPYRDANVVGLYDRARDRIFTLTQASGEGIIMSREPTYEELPEPTFDEIKQEDGVWKAYKRISDVRVDNTVNTSRTEYAPLAQEEVYILDDQTIPTELTVANQGTEEILPANGTTPTTAPAIMEIQYPSIPTRGGLLFGNNNEEEKNDEDNIEEENNEEEIIEEINER